MVITGQYIVLSGWKSGSLEAWKQLPIVAPSHIRKAMRPWGIFKMYEDRIGSCIGLPHSELYFTPTIIVFLTPNIKWIKSTEGRSSASPTSWITIKSKVCHHGFLSLVESPIRISPAIQRSGGAHGTVRLALIPRFRIPHPRLDRPGLASDFICCYGWQST